MLPFFKGLIHNMDSKEFYMYEERIFLGNMIKWLENKTV